MIESLNRLLKSLIILLAVLKSLDVESNYSSLIHFVNFGSEERKIIGRHT